MRCFYSTKRTFSFNESCCLNHTWQSFKPSVNVNPWENFIEVKAKTFGEETFFMALTILLIFASENIWKTVNLNAVYIITICTGLENHQASSSNFYSFAFAEAKKIKKRNNRRTKENLIRLLIRSTFNREHDLT